MNTAQTNFTETNDSFGIAEIAKGRSIMMGVTEMGPVGDPSKIITSWANFQKIFGDLFGASDFPLLCKRALDNGAALRIIRVAHYTTITNASTLTAIVPVPNTSYTLLFSGPMLTGQSITPASVNGVTLSAVPFDTDNPTTMADLAAAYAALNTIASANVSPNPASTTGGLQLVITPASGTTLSLGTTVITGSGTKPVVTLHGNTNLGVTAFSGGHNLFAINPKYPGAAYNNLVVNILPASNGNSAYFDIQVYLYNKPYSNEYYANLTIPLSNGTNPNIANSHYLDKLIINSNLVTATYSDLSSFTGQLTPIASGIAFKSGSDGGTIVDTDYIGDSGAKTGAFSANPIDDCMQIACPFATSNAIHQAMDSYATNRTDLVYIGRLADSYASENALAAARVATGLDTTYTALFAGGLQVLDPYSGVQKGIPEVADYLALLAKSDTQFGQWYAVANKTRGKVPNCLGITNNFGPRSNIQGLNILANNQINPVIQRDGVNMFWTQLTCALADSQLSFLNVRRLMIFMRKSLGPVYEKYLQEPNDPTSWKNAFLEVDPWLDSLVKKRALYSYTYTGDQFAGSLKDLVYNNESDVKLGKYACKIGIAPIPGMREIDVNISIDKLASTVTVGN